MYLFIVDNIPKGRLYSFVFCRNNIFHCILLIFVHIGLFPNFGKLLYIFFLKRILTNFYLFIYLFIYLFFHFYFTL